MTHHKMHAIVREELEVYPRGVRGSAENTFRMIYTSMRLNSLGKRPNYPNSPEKVKKVAIALVQWSFPGFTIEDES